MILPYKTILLGRDQIKLFNLVWDALCSEFAGRHSLYERNCEDSKDIQRLNALQIAQMRGEVDTYKELVDPVLSGYDADSWGNQVWEER